MVDTSSLNSSDINRVQTAGSREAALTFLEGRLAPGLVSKRFADAFRTNGSFQGNDREESYFRYLTTLREYIHEIYPAP